MEKKIWDLKIIDIREYANDKHKTVDDTPYGGGSGMLLKPDVIAKSLDINTTKNEKIFYLSPRGKIFNQSIAKNLSKEKKININNNPPIFNVEFFPEQKNIDNINCYSNEGGKWEKSKMQQKP